VTPPSEKALLYQPSGNAESRVRGEGVRTLVGKPLIETQVPTGRGDSGKKKIRTSDIDEAESGRTNQGPVTKKNHTAFARMGGHAPLRKKTWLLTGRSVHSGKRCRTGQQKSLIKFKRVLRAVGDLRRGNEPGQGARKVGAGGGRLGRCQTKREKIMVRKSGGTGEKWRCFSNRRWSHLSLPAEWKAF